MKTIRKIGIILPCDVPLTLPGSSRPGDRFANVGAHQAYELAKRGYVVHVFAPGDSERPDWGVFHETVPVAFCNSPDRPFKNWPFVYPETRRSIADNLMSHIGNLGLDIVHNHDVSIIPSVVPGDRVLTTVHTCLNPLPHNRQSDADILRQYPDHPLVSVCLSQQRAVPDCRWFSCIPSGVPVERFDYNTDPHSLGRYAFFIGRMHPEKGVKVAIATILELNRRGIRLKLKIAGGTSLDWQRYLDKTVLAACREYPGCIEYMVGVGFEEKNRLYKRALFTIVSAGCEAGYRTWHGTNSLVIRESFAAGTPILIGNKGSAPELVRHEENGYLVDMGGNDSNEMVASRFADGAEKIMVSPSMRAMARTHATLQCSVVRMVNKYEMLYERLLKGDLSPCRFN